MFVRSIDHKPAPCVQIVMRKPKILRGEEKQREETERLLVSIFSSSQYFSSVRHCLNDRNTRTKQSKFIITRVIYFPVLIQKGFKNPQELQGPKCMPHLG